LNFGTMTAEHLAGIYGEVFSKLVREAVVRFVSEKVGEAIPKVDTIEEAANYVRSRTEKYPFGHCSFWYGIGKAESQLQGSAGAATRLYLRDIVKRMTELDGPNELVGKINDTTRALLEFRKIAVSMELLDEESFECTGNSSASEVRIRNCPNGDGCKQMMVEGIIRSGSNKPLCTISLGSAVTAEVVTKVPHDYDIVELNPPNCVVRISRL
jgi:hypothetical protein